MASRKKLAFIAANDFERIHAASLRILEETGVKFQSDEALQLFGTKGARVTGSVVHIPAQMVADALVSCPSQFEWNGRNRKYSVTVGDAFLVQPNVGPVFVRDIENGRRQALLEDYRNYIRLCQASDVVDLNGSLPLNPSDVSNSRKHLIMMYEILKHTDKPIIGFCLDRRGVCQTLEMVQRTLGCQQDFAREHWLGVLVDPLSPLAYGPESVETIIEYARRNQIIFLAPCIIAGVSGPISLMGTAVLQNVEILAGLVLSQLVNPGTPVVYATASTVGDMKTAAFAAGSPEAMLINGPCLQLASEYYHLPIRTMCGITHAKQVDYQAGYETMQSLMLGMLSGAHIFVQCLGTLEALMCVSFEKIILDMEIISGLKRISQGIDVSDSTLAVDLIQRIGIGGGYMADPSTALRCRTLWRPQIADWNSYDIWRKSAEPDLLKRANRRYKGLLAQSPESLIDAAIDRELQNYVQKAA